MQIVQCNYKHTVILLSKFFFFFFQGYPDIQQDKVEPLTQVNHFLWLVICWAALPEAQLLDFECIDLKRKKLRLLIWNLI